MNVSLAGARLGGPDNEGDFIAIGLASGVQMGGLDRVYGGLIAFETTVFGGDGQGRDFRGVGNPLGISVGDSMIQVNRYGRRICCEKRMLDNHIEHQYRDPRTGELPNRVTFQLYDQRTADLFDVAGPAPHIIRADDLSQLTRVLADRLHAIRDYTDNLTLDDSFEATLRTTIDRFNAYARQGVDAEFARGQVSVDLMTHLLPLWAKFYNPEYGATATWLGDGKTQEECVAEFKANVIPMLGNPYPNLTMYPIADRGPYYAIMLGTNPVDTRGS